MKKKFIAGITPVIILIILAVVAVGVYFLVIPQIKQILKPKGTYRIGVLSGLSYFNETIDGFKSKMAELGYIEGGNISYDIQETDFDMDKYKSILKKFVDDKVDLIFTFPTEASQEGKNAIQGTNIPLVFCHAYTEDTGLIDSVRHPGNNLTGVRWVGPDIALQHLEIMSELVPKAKRMWVPYQKNYPIVKSQLEALRPAAEKAGIDLVELPASDVKELSAVMAEKSKAGIPEAVIIIPEPLAVTPDAFLLLAKYCHDHNIPFGGTLVSMGGYDTVFGMIPRSIEAGKQAAVLADKVLRGTSAGTIPVVSAESYFQFSYKEAKRLGLTIPESLLNKADEIIR
jgi:putative ABC transport system substrate-binding protein